MRCSEKYYPLWCFASFFPVPLFPNLNAPLLHLLGKEGRNSFPYFIFLPLLQWPHPWNQSSSVGLVGDSKDRSSTGHLVDPFIVHLKMKSVTVTNMCITCHRAVARYSFLLGMLPAACAWCVEWTFGHIGVILRKQHSNSSRVPGTPFLFLWVQTLGLVNQGQFHCEDLHKKKW